MLIAVFGLMVVIALIYVDRNLCVGTGSCQPAPDSSRVGGPHWLLKASVPERVAYFGTRCDADPYVIIGDPDTPPLSRADCIEKRISEDIHSACILTAPSTSGANAVTQEQRTATWQQCKADALAPHGF